MSEVLINGVGKKISISDKNIIISKTIGKNLEILLEDITYIDYEEGNIKWNGSIRIEWFSEGKSLSEKIMFRYLNNDIVKEFVNGVKNYLNNPNESLKINEKEKIGIFQQLNKESKEQMEGKAREKAKVKEKTDNLKAQGIPYCPKCYSTSLTTADKKLSIGRAAVGGALLGGTGAILGGLTSKKVELLCMNCGHRFKLGKR